MGLIGEYIFEFDHKLIIYSQNSPMKISSMENVAPNDIYDPSIQDDDGLIPVERKFMRRMMKEKDLGDYRYYFHHLLLCIVVSIVLFVHTSHHYSSLGPRVQIC
jgi:hypothetical protein